MPFTCGLLNSFYTILFYAIRNTVSDGKEPHSRFYKSAACCPRSLVPFKARATLPYKRVGFTVTAKQRQTSIANVYSITYNTLVWISRGRVWEQKRAQEREQTFQPPAQGLMNPSKPSAFSSYVSHVVFLCFVLRMQKYNLTLEKIWQIPRILWPFFTTFKGICIKIGPYK